MICYFFLLKLTSCCRAKELVIDVVSRGQRLQTHHSFFDNASVRCQTRSIVFRNTLSFASRRAQNI